MRKAHKVISTRIAELLVIFTNRLDCSCNVMIHKSIQGVVEMLRPLDDMKIEHRDLRSTVRKHLESDNPNSNSVL